MPKIDIGYLRDTFKIGYEVFEESRLEAAKVWEYYHNRQFDEAQLIELSKRNQPAETFNVIKAFTRLLVGYFSTVVNTVKVLPVQQKDIVNASVLNDLVKYIFRKNNFDVEGDKIKIDGLLSGFMCSFINVVNTDKTDEFGRVLKEVKLNHVPTEELVLDPKSRLEDYSDATFIHRFRWLDEHQLKKLLPKKKDLASKLVPYDTQLDITGSDFEDFYNEQFVGETKQYDNFFIIHSIMKGDNNKVWSVYWNGFTIIDKKEITYKEVKFPYRVQKIHLSSKAEYYGIFREILSIQDSINVAVIKLQLMSNTTKVFYEKKSVKDIAKFTREINKVNAVIGVESLKGILVDNNSKEVLDQYTIIDKALDRIQRILNINDSFLGLAFASDSGRKVKLQQNATILGLKYIAARIEKFYELLGMDTINLSKQYLTANQVFDVADDIMGQRWIELNRPLTQFTGQYDENGQPIFDYVYEEKLDPETGKPLVDSEGNIIIAPIPSAGTEIAFSEVDVEIESVFYNDEDEKNQLMIETILSGNIGNTLLQLNPAGFLQISSLAVKGLKTKYSPIIAGILEQTAAALQAPQNANFNPDEQPSSQQFKLPQNTNE